jgi:hypothetical protein
MRDAVSTVPRLRAQPSRTDSSRLLIFRDKVRLSVGRLAAACQSRRRTARPRWCNALSPHAVHQAGPAASRVAFQVQ